MALSAKAIKRKIVSVKNTKKITKAMELVAASKMRKTVEKTIASREYAFRALELLAHIAHDQLLHHSLLERRTGDRMLVVLVASNKGLCGSYNVHVLKKLQKFVREYEDFSGNNGVISALTVGVYAERYARSLSLSVVGSFVDVPDTPSFEDVRSVAQFVIKEYTDGAYDGVVFLYTRFISAMSSTVVRYDLLPMTVDRVEAFVRQVGADMDVKDIALDRMAQYRFEPDEDMVLDEVLPRLIEVQLYQGILEARSAEHSSRMLAMKNASENADSFVRDLTLHYNKARQAAITQELVEIATAADAIS